MSKGGAIGLEGSKTWRRRGENGSDSKVFSVERMIVKMGGRYAVPRKKPSGSHVFQEKPW